MKPTLNQFESFQKLYEYFNSNLFNPELPNVILNFSRKNQVAGFFAKNSWVSTKGSKVHEISINPLSLCRGKKYVLQTLVHEMCHLWQFKHGTPSRAGYHNKEWADKMESIGLMPSDTEKPGGKKTGQSMSDYIIENGTLDQLIKKMPKKLWLPFKSMEYLTPEKINEIQNEPIDDIYAEIVEVEQKKGKKKSKYTCPVCGINLWGKSSLKVKCEECNTLLIEK